VLSTDCTDCSHVRHGTCTALQYALLLLRSLNACKIPWQWMRHATSTSAIREYPPLEPADATAAVHNVLTLLSTLLQQLRHGLQEPHVLRLDARITAIGHVQVLEDAMLRLAVSKLPIAQFKPALDYAMQQLKLALHAEGSHGQVTAGVVGQGVWAPGQHCALALRSVLSAFKGYHSYATLGDIDNSAAVQSQVAARLVLAAQPLQDLLRAGPTDEHSCLTLPGSSASTSTSTGTSASIAVPSTSWSVALALMHLVSCSECDQASQALPALLEQLSEHIDWFTEVGACLTEGLANGLPAADALPDGAWPSWPLWLCCCYPLGMCKSPSA
jgi:hypothetical protein